MSKMTKIQFDTIRSLSVAYRHEWATNLDMARHMGQTGMTYREYAMRYYAEPSTAFSDGYVPDANDLAHCGAWRAWIALSDRVALGHVPTTEEISDLATPLFENEHFPSTCHVALKHETCTGRTRWEVLHDGEVRFEFVANELVHKHGAYRHRGDLLCRARVYTARNGNRDALVDAVLPLAEWGLAQDENDNNPDARTHRSRIAAALVAAGCSTQEAERAVEAARFGGPKVCLFDLRNAA